MAYRLVLNKTAGKLIEQTTLLRLSAKGERAATFKFGRIDVDDVALTAGTETKVVRGSYSVYRLDGESRSRVSYECETNSGISVLPGKNVIGVRYEDPVSGQKTTEYTANVR